jgi:hypothetical protein
MKLGWAGSASRASSPRNPLPRPKRSILPRSGDLVADCLGVRSPRGFSGPYPYACWVGNDFFSRALEVIDASTSS